MGILTRWTEVPPYRSILRPRSDQQDHTVVIKLTDRLSPAIGRVGNRHDHNPLCDESLEHNTKPWLMVENVEIDYQEKNNGQEPSTCEEYFS